VPETQRLTSETSWILRVSESKANYWATYAVDFSLMLFFIGWDGFRLGYGVYAMAGMFALGLLVWTLTEYCAHRWLYHWGFALTRSGHDKHHDDPLAHLAMPWFVTPLLFLPPQLLVAGYYGGWIDEIVMRLADVTLAFPTLLLLIAMAAALQPSLGVVFLTIGIVGWAGMARLVRGQVLVVRQLEFVQASRALGARDTRVVLQHVLPSVVAPVLIAVTLGVAAAIMAESALSFLGLGVQPPTPSWGSMIADGRDLNQLRNAPWTSVAPGLAIGVAVLGFNLLGDALRDALDPRHAAKSGAIEAPPSART